MYTNAYGTNGMKENGKIYEIKNNYGRIEIVEHNCYLKNKFYFFRDYNDVCHSGQIREDYYKGITKDSFHKWYHENLNFSKFSPYLGFVDTNKEVLIKEWNAQINNEKLTKVPVLKNRTDIVSFEQLFKLASRKIKGDIDDYSLVIQPNNNSHYSIKINLEKEDDGYCFYCNDISKIENYIDDIEDLDYCDGSCEFTGYISEKNIEKYFAKYGIDMSRTYLLHFFEKSQKQMIDNISDLYGDVLEEKEFIILSAFDSLFSGSSINKEMIFFLDEANNEENLIYELITAEYTSVAGTQYDTYIIAHEITNENNNEWICHKRKFSKNQEKTLAIFEPFNYDKLYGISTEEIIGIYNANLDKFKL